MHVAREAVVLAGGFGTRLAHVVGHTCKPMAPVAGRPFLRYVMDQLATAGIERVVVADGYLREQIEGFFGGAYRGMEVVYSPEDEPLGTGGAARRALGLCEGEWAFLLNGDTLFDVDFGRLNDAANGMPGSVEAVVAVKRLSGFDRYGTVEVAEGGRIVSFAEKRPCDEGLVNGGVYLIRSDVLAGLPEAFPLEDVYLDGAARRGALVAVEFEGDFVDIGVPEDYERSQEMLAPRARGWKLAMFDRDGTINVDVGHLHDPSDLQFVPGTLEVMRRYAKDPDYRVVVLTNQAGIAKGLYAESDMRTLHRYMASKLAALGCRVDAWYFCPHHPEFTGPCGCRKPEPGMLLAAMRDFDADPSECVMYGDSESDMQGAAAAGVDGVLL